MGVVLGFFLAILEAHVSLDVLYLVILEQKEAGENFAELKMRREDVCAFFSIFFYQIKNCEVSLFLVFRFYHSFISDNCFFIYKMVPAFSIAFSSRSLYYISLFDFVIRFNNSPHIM